MHWDDDFSYTAFPVVISIKSTAKLYQGNPLLNSSSMFKLLLTHFNCKVEEFAHSL